MARPQPPRKAQQPVASSPKNKAELLAAIKSEKELADKAAAIWAEEDGAFLLTEKLWNKLYPLLCEPIPDGFIETIGNVPGKPYESTGIKSVQVQIDRMNAILKPQNWFYEDEYFQDGKLAKVTVTVRIQHDSPAAEIHVSRSSMGGVGQASSAGNYYKGSFTNAAKIAFARIGVGHEVYVGAADLDPDTNQEAANQPAVRQTERPPAKNKRVDSLIRLYKELYGKSQPDERFKLFLGSLGVTGATQVKQAFEQLDEEKADQVGLWLSEKLDLAEEDNASDN